MVVGRLSFAPTFGPTVMTKALAFWHVLRAFGPRWVRFRVGYALRQRLGVSRWRLPVGSWADYALSHILADTSVSSPETYARLRQRNSGGFFFEAKARGNYTPVLRGLDADPRWAEQRLAAIEAGQLRFFSGETLEVGWPPRWSTHAMTGQTAPVDIHFSRIDEFAYGDVKVIWEPSRFGFVYDLVRIAWRGDAARADRCAELFWEAVDDWMNRQRPFVGINWKCGQEAALRTMAWAFGYYAFADRSATTAHRHVRMAQLMAATARRIEENISYALSQQNNHGVSEAMGLWTIGLLWPELRGADRWRQKGRHLLEQLAEELIYDDGGFSQNSANYHRVMLHDYLWAIRLGQVNDQPLSQRMQQRVAQAGRFLEALADHQAGQVPRFGQDDGALVLPLTGCRYCDYRPTIQAMAQWADQAVPYGSGAWDEMRLWLFGPDAIDTPRRTPLRADAAFTEAGSAVLRSDRGVAVLRCAAYRHRPSQLDQLHMDLWWRGHNVALDPSTYSYNAPGRWASIPLASTAAHNTVTVDDCDQADRAGRFMYLPWPSGSLQPLRRSAGGHLAAMGGHHNGYHRLADSVDHRRSVLRIGSTCWVVIDHLRSREAHRYRLHWLLADALATWDADAGRAVLELAGDRLAVQILPKTRPSVFDLKRAEEDSPRGWYAPRYQQLAPAVSVTARCVAASVWWATLIGDEAWQMRWTDVGLTVNQDRLSATIGIRDGSSASSRVTRVDLSGDLTDSMEL